MRPSPPRHHGFTLLELLISLALITVLAASLFAFLLDNLAARDRVREIAARHRAVTIFFDQLEVDLMTCLVGDPTSGPGIDGDNTTLNILSRSVPIALAGNNTNASQLLGDLLRTNYTFDDATGVVSIQRGPAATSATAPEGLGATWFRTRFRYHDGSDWRDTFDSMSADQLPVAIEVMIWFHPWPGEEPLEPIDAPADTLERSTFDDSAMFDEFEVAMESDSAEFEGEPRPDRIHIFAIPDAAASEEGVEADDDSTFAHLPMQEANG